MFAAHMDEIGFMVKKIEADGRLRVCNMGWNGDDDGYYLSEVFDTNDGPEYEWEPGQSAANTKSTEGESHNYQFYQKAIIGIRK